MKKKPDALVLLALIFGLGLAISALTHGDGEPRNVSAAHMQSVQASQ